MYADITLRYQVRIGRYTSKGNFPELQVCCRQLLFPMILQTDSCKAHEENDFLHLRVSNCVNHRPVEEIQCGWEENVLIMKITGYYVSTGFFKTVGGGVSWSWNGHFLSQMMEHIVIRNLCPWIKHGEAGTSTKRCWTLNTNTVMWFCLVTRFSSTVTRKIPGFSTPVLSNQVTKSTIMDSLHQQLSTHRAYRPLWNSEIKMSVIIHLIHQFMIISFVKWTPKMWK